MREEAEQFGIEAVKAVDIQPGKPKAHPKKKAASEAATAKKTSKTHTGGKVPTLVSKATKIMGVFTKNVGATERRHRTLAKDLKKKSRDGSSGGAAQDAIEKRRETARGDRA